MCFELLFAVPVCLLLNSEAITHFLRVLSAIEFYSNPEKLVSHEIFLQDYGFLSKEAAFTVSLRGEIVRVIKYPSKTMGIHDKKVILLKAMASDLLSVNSYSSFIAILALVEAICTPVCLFTTFMQDQRQWNLFNQTINPCLPDKTSLPFYLFWYSTSGDNALNHFVPLMNNEEVQPSEDNCVLLKEICD